jgi:arginine exporter protein ArgO
VSDACGASVTAALVAGLVAGYGVALPVGAIATYLVALSAREPWRISVSAALGVATADGALAAAAALGGVGLERLIRPASRLLTAAAAGVVLALALRTAVRALRRYRHVAAFDVALARGARPARTYLRLTVLTALNPGTLAYFAALVLGAQQGAPETGAALLFALGAFAASASWQLVLAGSGAAFGRILTGPRGQLAVAAVSSSIMVALAGKLLASLP